VTRAGKDVVRRWAAEMVVGGDLAVADELFSPDLAASARHWGAPFRTSFSDVQMQVVDLVAEGDRVAGRFRSPPPARGSIAPPTPTGRPRPPPGRTRGACPSPRGVTARRGARMAGAGCDRGLSRGLTPGCARWSVPVLPGSSGGARVRNGLEVPRWLSTSTAAPHTASPR
jgi:hypothetical protein